MEVYIATQHLAVPDCPAELEVESAAILGVYNSEEEAGQATAEDAAERLAEFEEDDEGIDQAIEYLDYEYRWEVTAQPVQGIDPDLPSATDLYQRGADLAAAVTDLVEDPSVIPEVVAWAALFGEEA